MNNGHTKTLGDYRISMEHNDITIVMFIEAVDELAKNKIVFGLNAAKK